ncbi:hypothetical protein CFOLD11_32520 [Clostridium folliculivorans]|uniref:Pilus assembly protein PilO n=1 Tax=Clostridium folliculivorans TaxID=2886038 RepID=A0A9W5Y4I2_9CLOT|nr:hypothetical protein [Clostridium folliculivorans]GKU26425.1 hypothetical protein CFOLD11_32520 [Clostridium folliculivorans]
MKISEREKYLLGILLAVLVVVGYYEFVYTKQIKKIDGLKTQKIGVESKYNEIMSTINTMDSKKENLKILNAKIEDKSKNIYPELIQEKLILEIDELLKSSNLKGNINFSKLQVQGIESNKSSYQPLPNSSLQSLADQYNNENSKNNSASSSNQASSSGQISQQTGNDGQTKDVSAGNTAQQIKVTLSFKGTYSNLSSFIKNVEVRDKRIVLSNLSMAQSNQKEISGSLTMEFYAVPKIGDEDSNYSNWLLNNKYGKGSPFGDGQMSTLATTIENSAKEKEEKSDFSMIVKPINSDLPTLTIGKDKDQSRTSYLYADNPGIEKLEVTFTKDKDGNYYYKYKTSKNSYPLQYTTKGIGFTPSSNDIMFNIFSTLRQGNDDKASVELKVINNTDKVVSLIVNGDDATNPRVSITGEGTAVNITKR